MRSSDASHVRKTLVESEEQARRHRFETSPTVRVNGRDIAFETLESRCDSCTDLCRRDEGTNCRMWRYGGQEYTEAPVGLVVEAILGEVYGETPQVASEPAAYEDVPENFSRFLAGRSAKEAAAEDIVHDVLLRAYARRDTLRDRGKLGQWLYQIARNAIIDHYRRCRPTEELPDEMVDE
jgi:hypothetical protein